RGELVAQLPTVGANKAQLAELMVGRKVDMPSARAAKQVSDMTRKSPLLDLNAVHTAPQHGLALRGVSLQVAAGEIVAIAGVSGNGQNMLAELLSGLVAVESGTARFDGEPLPATPRRMVQSGIGRVPEDRHAVGTIGDLTVWENATLETYRSPPFAKYGLRRPRQAILHAGKIVREFDVRLTNIHTAARTLSGGNMQKLILGRVLSNAPRLIVVNQPTWGLDIGAVAYVHQRLLEACATGTAILLISEDLEEVFALADRIAVMHAGRLGHARPACEWSLTSIGLAMAGGEPCN
ncbi:MAG: ATP-binding cassette domain-containing protein, partial [Betaproteobacteria bacterium]|nr:ATP-binding cassette domain-containing protein [Betaproteobacteria bacterium]